MALDDIPLRPLSYLILLMSYLLSLISGNYQSIEGIYNKKATALNKVLEDQNAILDMVHPTLILFAFPLHLKAPIEQAYQSSKNTI